MSNIYPYMFSLRITIRFDSSWMQVLTLDLGGLDKLNKFTKVLRLFERFLFFGKVGDS